ncbi:energy transducer TonB [Candidatus Phycosocius spiralis]|uniref:TonB C-terminal domain-containing protein n=1 Tax=Candidatus Phycosocius spiralis TaxID=2815099 RepID=A0ABQ4PTR0_9PROT|nr:energy transducer TonB [Candidatus Phycosocius spiralis]GIU66383.1 hypothetical protein PsB1_0537 [Candidatus Phycosocius spiralis]
MAKYRMLFLLISILIWTGILYGVSKIRPELVSDFMDNLNVVKAEKEKPKPPPPPPPPPPEKLPPPPPLVERQTRVVVDIPPPPQEEIRETVVRAPPTQLTDYQPPAPPPPPPPPPPPSCTEGARNARKIRDFNVDRAYPQRAVDRGTEGNVRATLQIDASGSVVGVIITSANPPGVFDSAVEREARRMKFEPARRNCENVADDYPLDVQFKLDE